jgi:TolB-like protein/Flp pilus assembly protein TadD
MSDLSGTTLGHYRILEKIGAGGMGVVYRAHDERLDRDVAVKVLPEEVTAKSDRVARFEREARAVARLEHPNILAIHEFGTEDGVTYAVTELLEGETLRERIPSAGIGWQKAAEIGAAVAEGLAASHGKGIVHRDLKPENVFVTSDGRVKILDFGLAQMREPLDGEADTATLTPAGTVPGTVMGTVGYMSPEQVRGKPADERSDVFALGCVLYEMLTGRIAFARQSAADTQAAVLKEEPAPLSGSSVTLPAELERTVRRCLEKSPDARFQSASDLAYNLRSITTDHAVPVGIATAGTATKGRRGLPLVLTITAAVIVVVAVWLLLRPAAEDPAGVEALPRVAVLPFENLGAPEDEYFADGMTDEVRGKLFNLAGLEVIARYSSDQYRGTTEPPSQIAEELGARYLLTAKVRWQKSDDGSDRVRVTPELVDVQPGTPPVALWHDAFDATLSDVFQVQGDIATRVARALDVTLSFNEEQFLQRRPTDNPAAYDAFLKAEQLEREGVGGTFLRLEERAELYRRAVALDPEFAVAWARLSAVETNAYRFGGVSSARIESARGAAERALEIDPSLPDARLAMAFYLSAIENDSIRVDEQLALGLETAPNDPRLRRWWTTRALPWEERRAYFEERAELDPLSWSAAFSVGLYHFYSRDYREAEEWLDRASYLAPTSLEVIRFTTMLFLARGDLEGAKKFVRVAAERVDQTELVANLAVFQDLYWVLDDDWQQLLFRLGPELFGGDGGGRSLAFAHTHYLRGEWEQTRAHAEMARAEFAQTLTELPDEPEVNLLLGSALAYLGRKEEAITHGRRGLELSRDSRTGEPTPYCQLQVVRNYIILGETELALDFLEPILEVPHYLSPGWLSVDPLFDPLRDHPRFQALLEGS